MRIHDNGSDDPIPFDLTGWQPVVQGIRKALEVMREEEQAEPKPVDSQDSH